MRWRRWRYAAPSDLPYEPLLHALCEFEGLPHRVQKVAEITGVSFYDDSKGTNVGATVAALMGMRAKVVLIAGGDGKGQDFSPLAATRLRGMRARVVLIGRDREKIAAAMEGGGVAILRARRHATTRCAPAFHRRTRATRCCCRRRAPASTCSATTSIARRCSSRRCGAWRRAQ